MMKALIPIINVKGRVVPVIGNNIDTDCIIPARFMKGTRYEKLGEYTFYDDRFTYQGKNKLHPLNKKGYYGSSILVVEDNFGCGSSREHAPNSLYIYGIRAIIGISFAEIFRSNTLVLGIPCINIRSANYDALKESSIVLTIDIIHKQVKSVDTILPIMLKDTSSKSLIHSEWDPLYYLIANKDKITAISLNIKS